GINRTKRQILDGVGVCRKGLDGDLFSAAVGAVGSGESVLLCGRYLDRDLLAAKTRDSADPFGVACLDEDRLAGREVADECDLLLPVRGDAHRGDDGVSLLG